MFSVVAIALTWHHVNRVEPLRRFVKRFIAADHQNFCFDEVVGAAPAEEMAVIGI